MWQYETWRNLRYVGCCLIWQGSGTKTPVINRYITSRSTVSTQNECDHFYWLCFTASLRACLIIVIDPCALRFVPIAGLTPPTNDDPLSVQQMSVFQNLNFGRASQIRVENQNFKVQDQLQYQLDRKSAMTKEL